MHNDQELPAASSWLDRFLQEQNIQWMLGIGTTLLLASSLMLVTTHWSEAQYTPFWKYLTLLAYFALVFAASQGAYYKSALRKTGTVLMAVSVMLVPLSFLGLRWMHGWQAVGVTTQVAEAAALLINLAWCTFVTGRVFQHFLRGWQPTFVGCFLALSAAGAVLPSVPSHTTAAGAAVTSLVLWSLFAAGTVKVNRHVFWLVEQRQAPRICGFFPILLLGGQFLLLFTLDCAPHVARQWWGLGCTLSALPILLTADAVARVFQQRTGNLVRPWPPSVGVPLVVGLLCSLAGVCLAGADLRPPHEIPLAFVPTAMLAALTAGLVARRTGHPGLVWAMLVLVIGAYNFSYVFFREAAACVLHTGAVAVQEARLPLAFYGLTYLPLLGGLLGSAWIAERRGSRLFAGPLRGCCAVLPTILLALGCTHAKALLPVGLVLTGFFALQTWLFGDRRLIPLGVCAGLVAAFGAVAFARLVWGLELPEYASLVSLAAAAFVLLGPGALVDRWADRLADGSVPPALAGSAEREAARLPLLLCQKSSGAVGVLLAVAWILEYGLFQGLHAWPPAGMIAVLLVVHALRWSLPELGSIAYGFAGLAGLSMAVDADIWLGRMLDGAVALLIVQWCVGRLLERYPRFRTSRAFGPVLRATSLGGCTLLLAAVCLPLIAGEMIVTQPGHWWPAAGVLGPVWPCRLLLVAWAFAAAAQTRRPWLTRLACVAMFAAVGAWFTALCGVAGYEWLPAVWAGAALVGQIAVGAARRRFAASNCQRDRLATTILAPVDEVCQGVQWVIAVGALLLLAWPARIAAGLAVAGLAAAGGHRQGAFRRPIACALANLHVLILPLAVLCPGIDTVASLTLGDVRQAALAVALLAAASLYAWQRLPARASQDLLDFHGAQLLLLRIIVAGMLGVSLLEPRLSLGGAAAGALVFALLAGSELFAACRHQQAERAWSAQVVVATAVGYLVHFGWIRLDQGAGMFAAVAAAVLLRGLARLVQRRRTAAILTEPFQQAALLMPVVAVVLGLVRHATGIAPQWLGANSLALLLAAAIYFWHGVEQRQPRWWLASAAIVNVALALLWRELRLSDPQFYMIPLGASILALVQVLKRDVPRTWHDPLNYLGALVILVSPTFHIVGGSWLHLVTLMVASVAVAMAAIGLHVRALLYAGSAFLAADLVSMVVRGSVDHPNLLWVAGLALGSGVVALAAVCENNREKLLQRARIVSAALQAWD